MRQRTSPFYFESAQFAFFKNIFVCSPKLWKWAQVSLRSCAAGLWQLSSPWSTWGLREESSPRLEKEKLPGWVMTLRSTLRFQECTMPLSCLFSQLPGSRLQLWDWTEHWGKEWGGPFYRKVKGKIHPAGIRGSLRADLRQPHHRNRKAGERGAVASRQHWLLAVFGSCLGSEGGRFDSL